MPRTVQERVNERAKQYANADGHTSHKRRSTIRLDEVAKEDYLKNLPRVFTTQLALKAAGALPSQLARWREEDAEFLVREHQAKDLIADQLEAEAIRRGFKGTRKPVYQGGLLAGHVTEYSDQLLIFMLKGLRPEKYRERSEIAVNPIVKVVSGFEPGDVV